MLFAFQILMQLPHRFGRYVLLKKIAQGGMAEIYHAKYLGENGFAKDMAIKRLLPVWSENPDFIKMLIDEAKALVQLTHPNIVQVFELGRDGKTMFIAMEWVVGLDLKQLFEKIVQDSEKFPPSFIFYIILEILKALEEAHAKNIIHRDISPQNILLSYDGQVKLTDFGIAKGSHRSLETTKGEVKGKFSYMSPEQARGERVGPATDLYSLGIIFYELLEGKRLFDGINDLATLEAVREARLPADALMAWPSHLRGIALKALEKNVGDRFASARDFLKALQEYCSQIQWQPDIKGWGELLKNISPPVQKRGVEETALPLKKKGDSLWVRGALLFVSLIAGIYLFFPEAKPGQLKVSARPWGEVTIPGFVRGRETPLERLLLKAGAYQIRVHFPPKNLWVEEKINITSGSTIFCKADFTKVAKLHCLH